MINQILNSHADSLQKIWAHDRTQTIGASEIGQCARKTFWIKNEIDPKHRAERDAEYQDGWGAKIRGTIMENEFWTPAAIISSQHAPLMAAAMAGGIVAGLRRARCRQVAKVAAAARSVRLDAGHNEDAGRCGQVFYYRRTDIIAYT